MRVQIQKWGNSLALRIPKSFAKEAELQVGSLVNLLLDGKKLIIERCPQEEAYRLDELLSEVREDNIHGEIDYGSPKGKERW